MKGERRFEHKESSLWNSLSPWIEPGESITFKATVSPEGRVALWTEPKPPWPRRVEAENEFEARRRME